MKQALLYDRLDTDSVVCHLCHHMCTIKNERWGICRVRQNRNGILYTFVYDRIVAEHVDPIEKKPLFHFLPGSKSYSVATVGCNFHCQFCQNSSIAQMPRDQGRISGIPMTPGQVVQSARNQRCQTIAYTYTEPTIYFEFALETAQKAHEQGIQNIFVSNGFMSEGAITMISPWLDAANIDLKAIDNAFYKNYCSARLQPVLDNLVRLKANGVFIEITTLMIPDLNDDPKKIKKSAKFIVRELGPDVPWHISRFHPTYHMKDRPATSVETLQTARKIGLDAGLRYVYTGNIPGDEGESTFCHHCGKLLIERYGFTIQKNVLKDNMCPECQTPVNVITGN
ncbi:MAG: AmmeMemoRadiSam system radical SAM enzyme [Candidatus Magnetomorum sp.]|nr:AmmeMemoRadiSam system radical SAM enzyme [Candidatus Magnetomorum sp.]